METAQASRIVELESLEATQARRIVKLEDARANLKLEKQNVTVGYRRLVKKYKRPEEKANVVEHEKTDATEAHAGQLAEVDEKLAKETQDYTDYCWDVRHSIHELHKVMKASLRKVGVRCLPFPAKNALIDDYIGWFEEEVKVVPGLSGS
jgi:uncharacterized coiled-coil protein SlyX